MKTVIPYELRDLDGSYLLVEPMDAYRCRVLDSNVAPKGEILWRPRGLSWRQASQDRGGWTRVAPSELLGPEGKHGVPDHENILEILEREQEVNGEHRRPDPEGELADPKSLSPVDPDWEMKGFKTALDLLADHHRRIHGHHDGPGGHLPYCACPGFGPAGEQARGARVA